MSTKTERYSATMDAIRARQDAKRPKPAPVEKKKAKAVKPVDTYVSIEEAYPGAETVIVEDEPVAEDPDGE